MSVNLMDFDVVSLEVRRTLKWSMLQTLAAI